VRALRPHLLILLATGGRGLAIRPRVIDQES
jgi:hypothetical protein